MQHPPNFHRSATHRMESFSTTTLTIQHDALPRRHLERRSRRFVRFLRRPQWDDLWRWSKRRENRFISRYIVIIQYEIEFICIWYIYNVDTYIYIRLKFWYWIYQIHIDNRYSIDDVIAVYPIIYVMTISLDMYIYIHTYNYDRQYGHVYIIQYILYSVDDI